MDYSINKEFYDDDDYSKKAEWCNKNGYIIEETTPDENGERRFIITEPPQPTKEELLQIELRQLLEWFEEYDNQVKQYERCIRLNIAFDKDINELDRQATTNQHRIREIRNLLDK